MYIGLSGSNAFPLHKNLDLRAMRASQIIGSTINNMFCTLCTQWISCVG